MRDYKKFRIYQDAYGLTREIYQLTREWPTYELYNLTSQIRKSAHSVNSNICEGLSRNSDADCRRFIYNAYASLKETENHLQMAFDIGYLKKETYETYFSKMDSLCKMLYSFIEKLKADSR